jgi:CBS domain-containing protein
MATGIKTICQWNVDTISCDDNVAAAADRMRQRTVGSLVVVDEEKHPVGIVTDRDLVIRALADAKDADTTPVVEVMTPDIVVAKDDIPIAAAVRMMREGKFRRLPVVNREGLLIGLLTLDDILMRLARELGDIGGLIELETPAAAAANPL